MRFILYTKFLSREAEFCINNFGISYKKAAFLHKIIFMSVQNRVKPKLFFTVAFVRNCILY
jgi:hypothetical protein